MAEQTPPERDVVARHLGQAWSAFTPDASLQERVRARLTSSTAATLGALGTGAAMQPVAALQPRTAGTWASLSSSKLGMALLGAGLLGLGLISGYLIRDARQEPAVAPVVLPVVSSAAPVPLPPALGAPAPDPAPAAPEVTRKAPEQSSRARASRRARPATAQSEAPVSAAPPAEPSDELALLRRAERAVRNDDSALALALIAELEAHHPRSTLLEERRAVELLAYCVAGSSDAPARAQRFLREHPHSVHAGRISERCAVAGELSAGER